MEDSVKLIENFVSWQGEGPDSGRPMIILRFKTCNLKCPWCDTAVKMRITSESTHFLTDIQRTIYEKSAGLLITGGEPTVEKHFDETVLLLNNLEYPIANVESNGYKLFELISKADKTKKINYMYSPKIFSPRDLESSLEVVWQISKIPNVFIKIVWQDNGFTECFIKEICEKYDSLKWQQRIWLMPEGVTRKDLIKNAPDVFDVCEKYNLSFSSRNHMIFGFI
jgi:organic radical activating enzyme